MQKKRGNVNGKKPNGKSNSGNQSRVRNDKVGERDKKNGSRVGQTSRPNGNNDPSFYSLDSVLARNAASIPYAYPAGAPVRMGSTWAPHNTEYPTTPGVLAMRLAPTLGSCSKATDAPNMAAQQIYAFTTHANSRNTTYDAPDMMQYLLAMCDIYSILEFGKRAYGLARLYTYDNKYLPDSIFKASGLQAYSFQADLADYRLGLNTLIGKVATFAVPNSMSIIPRRERLYTTIYVDDTSDVREQLYLYVPDGFHVYDWKNNKLKYVQYEQLGSYFNLGSTAPYTAQDLLSIIREMINLVFNNNDLGTMNGDIQKAYGDNVHKVAYISEDYTVQAESTSTMLEQFRNAVIVSGLDRDSLDITSEYVQNGVAEGTPILKSHPQLDPLTVSSITPNMTAQYASALAARYYMFARKPIVTDNRNPAPEYNLDITRLVSSAVWDSTAEEWHLVCGTEIAVGAYLWFNPNSMMEVSWIGVSPTGILDACSGIVDTADAARSTLCAHLSGIAKQGMITRAFYFAPLQVTYKFSSIYKAADALSNGTDVGQIEEPEVVGFGTNFFAILDNQDLANMHAVAIANEFYVPRVGISLSN